MKLSFFKYQGTGNDFVMIDDRGNRFPENDQQLIERLCDRRFGIGADGLILLRNRQDFDFEMVYFNSDGRPSSMCGNGGRCTAAFARQLEIKGDSYTFLAPDGPHQANFEGEIVALQMRDLENIHVHGAAWVLNTGSPHYVRFVEDVESVDIIPAAHAVRYSDDFREKGINVNFVQVLGDGKIRVRTYERGVEDETFSCGTGVTASAIAYHHQYQANRHLGEPYTVGVETKGGSLKVKFTSSAHQQYHEVWLIGPAERVFDGEISLMNE